MKLPIPNISIPELPKVSLPKSKWKKAPVQNDSHPELSEEEMMAVAQQQFKKKYHFRLFRHDLVSTVVIGALLLIYVIGVLSIMSIKTVRGDGMSPSAKAGSFVVIDRAAYQFRSPARGDIVLSGGKIFRIIGLPGETISLNGGNVYIDDMIADETYLPDRTSTYDCGIREFKLNDGEYFTLCDNRNCYDDSRSGFYVTNNTITGKVIWVY